MPNPTIDSIDVNGTTYDITDTTSGYLTSVGASDVSYDDSQSLLGNTVQLALDTLDYNMVALDSAKQDTLVSGSNIKTINNNSILGSGNIDIQGGGTVIYDGDSTTDTPYDNLFAVTVGSGIDDVKVVVDMDLLWTNESPSSSFAGQTVSVSLSDYDYIGIIFKRTNETTSLYGTPMFILKVGTTWYYDDQIGGYLVERSVQTTATSVVFGASSRMTTYPNGSRTTDNTKQIPYQIFGIKAKINDLTGD